MLINSFKIDSKLPLFTVMSHITPYFNLVIPSIPNLPFSDSSLDLDKISSFFLTRNEAVLATSLLFSLRVLLKYSLFEL